LKIIQNAALAIVRSNFKTVMSLKRFEITLSIWHANSSGAQALSIGKVYGALGGRIRKIVWATTGANKLDSNDYARSC